MRTTLLLLASCVSLGVIGLRTSADAPASGEADKSSPVEEEFRTVVRPFLQSSCLDCHSGAKPKGDFDLSVFHDAESVARDLPRWELVLEQLDAKTMPPKKAKHQPTDAERDAVTAWVGAVRRLEASRHSGDPGAVLARRLNNAEYDYTIRDLTGVDLRPTKEFPVDPANEAGFDNSAESLVMSPALVKKYLEAARMVADHLVLTLDGFSFAPYPMLADTDRDKFCVNRIIDFYKRQRTDYADYFAAAWKYRHRAALGKPDASLADFATEAGISAKYLATIWAILNDQPDEIGPIAALQALWNELPGPDADRPDDVRFGCDRMRNLVILVRKQVTPEVKNMTARGISNGSQPFVLWKNRQYVANRMRYVSGARKIEISSLSLAPAAARALAVPQDPAELNRFEATFPRFCETFPDTFYVSERARVYLDPKDNVGNAGRLLSAGFHSMTGYFRDDGPLHALILDEHGQKELDRLWREFDFITGAPMRQYSSYLWYERAETSYLRDTDFDFVRAEDKDAASQEKIDKLAEVYLAKAHRIGVYDEAIKAVEDQFRIISASIRQVENDRLAAEPLHVGALQKFAERAYRRPLSPDERDGIASFYRTLRDQDGLSHEDAVRDCVVSILMSPHFCYRVDLPADGSGIRPLSDHDLASRLSYFLWSSMPDDELMSHAAAGDLHKPEVLAVQSRRMLRDERVRGFVTEFSGNWLDYRRFEEHNSVDRGRFPTFNDELRRSMFEEPIRYILDVVQNDRPVDVLLDGTHTFVNTSLAKHYGMPAPNGGPDSWVRVDDAGRYGRGGLLPMAVFLTRNSPGLRTSPVKRGYWVVRRLLGEKIPAPPADVPDLPDDEAKLGELTLRETLARHRADVSCATCHERFDAVGLAFEGYGPVGEFREKDLGGRPVDTHANFPDGMEGDGLAGLRDYLDAKRRPEFTENLCRKLLSYGLGRTLIPSDDETVESMKAGLAADGGRFSSLIERIVTSPQFRNKRVDAEQVE